MIFCILSRVSNSNILDKKNSTKFSSKAFRSEIRSHTNPELSQPALKNPAQVYPLGHASKFRNFFYRLM